MTDSYGELEKAHDTLMKAQNSLPVQVERNQASSNFLYF